MPTLPTNPQTIGASGHVNDHNTIVSAISSMDSYMGFILLKSQAISAASSVSVNGVFTSTYESYLLEYFGSISVEENIRFRMRTTAGGDDTSANYYYQHLTASHTTVSGYRTSTDTKVDVMYCNSEKAYISLRLGGPNLATRTAFRSNGASAVASAYLRDTAGQVATTTQYDGISLIAGAGTLTGTLLIYGLRK